MIFGILLTICAGILGVCGSGLLLDLIQTPDEIHVYAKSYLQIVLGALPFSFVYNFYGAMLRAVGHPKVPLMILAAASAVNLILDLLFVISFGWGIRGAAWATAAAQAFSAVLCVIYLKVCFRQFMFRRRDCRMDKSLLFKTAHYSFITGLQQTGLYIGKLLVQGSVNTAGTAVISAYTATTRIEGFINSFGDSGAAATSVVVAQNFGARQRERVRKSFSDSFLLMLVFGLLVSVLLYCTAGALVEFLLEQTREKRISSQFSISMWYLFFTSFVIQEIRLRDTLTGAERCSLRSWDCQPYCSACSPLLDLDWRGRTCKRGVRYRDWLGGG